MTEPQLTDQQIEEMLAAAGSEGERAELLCRAAESFQYVDLDRMLALALRAHEHALRSGDAAALVDSHTCVGSALTALRRLDEALPIVQESLQLALRFGSRADQGDAHVRLGLIHLYLSRMEPALDHLLTSLDIWEELGDRVRTGSALINIALVHASLENRSQARDYNLRAVAICEELGENDRLARVYGNLGTLDCLDLDFTSAERHYLLAVDLLNRGSSNREVLAQSVYNLGRLYSRTGRYAEGLEYYQEAHNLHTLLNNRSGIVEAEADIAICHFHLGHTERALTMLRNALAGSEQIQHDLCTMHINEALADVYAEVGEYQQALKHQRRLLEMVRTRLDLDRQKVIADMQVRYDLERERREKEELRSRMLMAQGSAVRSQINPHFISNALASIQAFLTEGDRTSAYRYLSRFGKLIRATLEHTRSEAIALQRELETLELYLELERLRFGDAFHWTITVDPAVDPVLTRVPPMLVQPFAENAIRHGLLPGRRRGRLTVRVDPVESGSLLLSVEDNGIGREESERRKALSGSLQSRESLGMALIEERCALLTASTGREHRITLYDLLNRHGKPAGTRVEILIPLVRSSDT